MTTRRSALGLVALWASVTALNLLWTVQDLRPPHWDRANHLANSLTYLELMSPSRIGEWLLSYTYYPPLLYWISDVVYRLTGTTDAWAAVLSQSFFLALLIAATYGIGRHLWGVRAGILAALFVVTTPMLVSGFKDYMLDAPVAAMAAVALYLLIRSEGFTRLRPSLLFGAACGLGLLTKWTFVFSLAVPAIGLAIVVLAQALRRRSWRRAVPVAGAAAVALAIAGPWYVVNRLSLLHDATLLAGCTGCGWYAKVEGDPPILTLRALLWYAWDLASLQLYLVPLVLLVVGVALAVRDRKVARRNRYPLLFVGGIYVVQTLLVSKDPRYSLPLIAGVAVLATYWIDRLRPPLRRVVTGGVVVYCVGTFLAMSFGAPFLPRAIEVRLPPSALISELPDFTPAGDFVSFRGLRLWSQQGYPLGQPSRERWYQEELFQTAARESAYGTLWFRGPAIDTIWFNDLALRYYAKRYGVRLVADPAESDVAAIRTLPSEPPDVPVGFSETRSHRLPDGTTLRLYRRG